MSQESTTAMADTPVDVSKPPAPGMVRVTFMPEGKVVEFEYGKMPYDNHGSR